MSKLTHAEKDQEITYLQDLIDQAILRFSDIAERHQPREGMMGSGAQCQECGYLHPCWTRRMVSGMSIYDAEDDIE